MSKKAVKKSVVKKIGISAAIREGLKALGVDAPAKDVGEYIAKKYPAHTATTQKSIWGTYVSQQRKGLRKPDGDSVGNGLQSGRVGAGKTTRKEVTIQDVIALRKFQAMLQSGVSADDALKLAAQLNALDQIELHKTIAQIEEHFGAKKK